MYSGPARTGEVYKQNAVYADSAFSGRAKHIDGGKFLTVNSASFLNSAGVHERTLESEDTVLF